MKTGRKLHKVEQELYELRKAVYQLRMNGLLDNQYQGSAQMWSKIDSLMKDWTLNEN